MGMDVYGIEPYTKEGEYSRQCLVLATALGLCLRSVQHR